MRRIALLLVLVTSAIGGGGEPKGPLAPITPFVDDLTLAVIHIDVARLNADQVWQHFQQVAGPMSGDKKAFLGMHAEFLRAGGKELFVLFNLADGPGEPLGVIPLIGGVNKQALRELLKQTPPDTQVQEKGDVLFFGSDKAVAAARQRKAKAVPELAVAYAAVEASAVQAILLPPRPFLRAQEELAPNLPKELGGGPVTTLTRGFQWGALGVNVVPKLDLKAIVQARDGDAALELQKLSELFVTVVAPGAQRDVPALAPLLAMLKPKVDGDRLIVTLDDNAIQSVLTPAISQTRAAASRAVSSNNLRQMALGMHNYHDVFKSLPPQASTEDQKKLLSWRVHLLPFVEGDALYRQFKLDEPWDSEHNKKLIDQMPQVYKSPLAKNLPAGKTVYLAAAGKQMAFEGPKGMSLIKIADGTSNTILLVEANDDHAVVWTQPEDYRPDRKDPAAPVTRKDAKGFHAVLADGSVRFFSVTADAELLWALLTTNGGEAVRVEDAERK